jgi:hypothetical protein
MATTTAFTEIEPTEEDYMIRKGYIAMIVMLVLGLTRWGLAQEKTGKTGYLTLSAAAQVARVVLPAGNYQVKHLVVPAGHFMEFVRVKEGLLDNRNGFEGTPWTYYDREVVATVPCTMQSLTATVGKTAIEMDGSRIARIQIKGENIAHNF